MKGERRNCATAKHEACICHTLGLLPRPWGGFGLAETLRPGDAKIVGAFPGINAACTAKRHAGLALTDCVWGRERRGGQVVVRCWWC